MVERFWGQSSIRLVEGAAVLKHVERKFELRRRGLGIWISDSKRLPTETPAEGIAVLHYV